MDFDLGAQPPRCLNRSWENDHLEGMTSLPYRWHIWMPHPTCPNLSTHWFPSLPRKCQTTPLYYLRLMLNQYKNELLGGKSTEEKFLLLCFFSLFYCLSSQQYTCWKTASHQLFLMLRLCTSPSGTTRFRSRSPSSLSTHSERDVPWKLCPPHLDYAIPMGIRTVASCNYLTSFST